MRPTGCVSSCSILRAEELAVDLAEALDAIAAVEQRDAVELADRWFHDQPAPDMPGPATDPGRPDLGG
jgi:hypothetical protein